MNISARLALIAALVTVLSACGAKGALFLPEKPAPVEEVAPVADPPAPATDASGTTVPVEPPVEAPEEVPATPPDDGNG